MGFAVAKPLRTVISDRGMNIYVGVAIGGKREIDMNDWAKFTIDPSLLEGTGKTLLPANYYTLADPEYFRVRKSNSPVADVGITFTNLFYEDSRCLTDYYALPFRMTENSMKLYAKEQRLVLPLLNTSVLMPVLITAWET